MLTGVEMTSAHGQAITRTAIALIKPQFEAGRKEAARGDGVIRDAAVHRQVLLEVLRPLGMWRMVLMPLVLVILMVYRPRGIMGLKEMRWFVPLHDLLGALRWRKKKEEEVSHAAAD